MVKVRKFKEEELIFRINPSLGLDEEQLFINCSNLKYRLVLHNLYVLFQSFVPLFGGVSFPYIVNRIASQPSTCIAKDLSLDNCLIMDLLEVVECAVRYEIIIQGSFIHQCGQLSQYSALNAKVIATLLEYFHFLLLARLYRFPWYLVIWSKWFAQRFPRQARSSGSWSPHPSSSDSHPCVGLELKHGWALPSCEPYFVLGSCPSHMYNLNCIIVIVFNCICTYTWDYTLVQP